MLTNWLERTVQLFLLDKGGMAVKLVNYNVHGIMVEHAKGRDFVPYSSVLLMRLQENEEKKPDALKMVIGLLEGKKSGLHRRES